MIELPFGEVEPHDERAFIQEVMDANERLGEAQVRIAVAAGVPPPYGVDAIVAAVEQLRAAAAEIASCGCPQTILITVQRGCKAHPEAVWE